MPDRPKTTVRYRVRVDPAVDARPSNVVHVGLDVAYGDEHARLVFEGFPRSVEAIEKALDGVYGPRGAMFDPRFAVTARTLRWAMESREMQPFAPELVDGADVFEREKP